MAQARPKIGGTSRIRLRSSHRSGVRLGISHHRKARTWSAPVKEEDLLTPQDLTPPTGKRARKAKKRKKKQH